MPYEKDKIPAENAPAPRSHDFNDYQFELDLWLANADDLELFDAESPAGGKRNFEFLQRVVTKTTIRGEVKGPGLKGYGVPYPIVKKLFAQVADELKKLNEGN